MDHMPVFLGSYLGHTVAWAQSFGNYICAINRTFPTLQPPSLRFWMCKVIIPLDLSVMSILRWYIFWFMIYVGRSGRPRCERKVQVESNMVGARQVAETRGTDLTHVKWLDKVVTILRSWCNHPCSLQKGTWSLVKRLSVVLSQSSNRISVCLYSVFLMYMINVRRS